MGKAEDAGIQTSEETGWCPANTQLLSVRSHVILGNTTFALLLLEQATFVLHKLVALLF